MFQFLRNPWLTGNLSTLPRGAGPSLEDWHASARRSGSLSESRNEVGEVTGFSYMPEGRQRRQERGRRKSSSAAVWKGMNYFELESSAVGRDCSGDRDWLLL